MNERLRKLLLVGVAATVVALELLLPLRRVRESKTRRAVRNAMIGGVAAATVQLMEMPVVMPLARQVERRRWGLLPRVPLPPRLKTLLALVVLDYTLYWWHVVVHRTPALWRFHAVHHADHDLDALTAIRFHFGELIASVPWRAAQVLVIGVPPATLQLWQTLTLASVLFHHSNTRLPLPLDSALSWLIVTPRMHGIHHSRAPDEMDANWSSGLAMWDRLHGTFRDDVPQAAIDIGVAGFDSPAHRELQRLLLAPFEPPDAAAASHSGWRKAAGP